jgi:8-oxo-dGTP diphosphatase
LIQPDGHLDIPSPYYRVSLKAIILDSRQRILVLQDQDGTWELPGGGLDHGESMQHCLRREIMEELGVGVDNINFSTMYPYISKGRTGHWRFKLALAVKLSDHDFKTGANVKRCDFVTAAELAKLPMVDSEAGIKTHIPRIWAEQPN